MINEAKFNIRTDISITTNDFEALRNEIHNDSSRNMICGVLYLHPNSNVQNFIGYLNTTTDKIQRENKYCIIMGDFHLDLLKLDSHYETELGSFFFLPHILQPTRIINHSEMLINNIIFNSLDRFTLNGNIVYDLTDHLPHFLIINSFCYF